MGKAKGSKREIKGREGSPQSTPQAVARVATQINLIQSQPIDVKSYTKTMTKMLLTNLIFIVQNIISIEDKEGNTGK
jgi:hypothetical protein